MDIYCIYSKTSVKRPPKQRQKILMTNGSLMQVESIAECPLGAFCNTFDVHEAIIVLKNNLWSFLRVAVLLYEKCSNKNATIIVTFFIYTLQSNIARFLNSH